MQDRFVMDRQEEECCFVGKHEELISFFCEKPSCKNQIIGEKK